MNEIWEFEGEEFEVAPHRLEEFLQEYEGATKVEEPGKTTDSPEQPEIPAVSQDQDVTGSQSVDISSGFQGIKHADVAQLKTGVGTITAEGDFVKNMNEYYRDTDIEFREATWGKDRFVMYDKSTQETSPVYYIPNAFEDTGLRTANKADWRNVQKNIIDFFDRKKTPVIKPGVTSDVNIVSGMNETEAKQWVNNVLPQSGINTEDSGTPGNEIEFYLPGEGKVTVDLRAFTEGGRNEAKGNLQKVINTANDRVKNPDAHAIWTEWTMAQTTRGTGAQNFQDLASMYEAVGVNIECLYQKKSGMLTVVKILKII